MAAWASTPARDAMRVATDLAATPHDKGAIKASLQEGRNRTLALAGGLSDEHLLRRALDILSPPVWDLGHMANFEDLWLVQRWGHDETLPGCNNRYNAILNPRAMRPSLDLPDRAGCQDYFSMVRRRALAILAEVDTDTGADASDPLTRAGFVYWMLVLHEHQHQETLLQTIQLRAGDYDVPFRYPSPAASQVASPNRTPVSLSPGAADGPPTTTPRNNWIRVAAGAYPMGRAQTAGVYDNEAPAHTARVQAFELAAYPVTNGSYLDFMEAGGYHDEAWWSTRGRHWLAHTKHHAPLHWRNAGGTWRRRGVLDDVPVQTVAHEILCHVNYWEAEAYAAWAAASLPGHRGVSLPTETQWEVAASNHEPATPSTARVDHYHWGPGSIHDDVTNHHGLRHMLGGVWEWTKSGFERYPGTQWFPYPDYSERFYGGDFRVLRGGSWATRATIATPWFRNWDLPQRKQIFSGIRLARQP